MFERIIELISHLTPTARNRERVKLEENTHIDRSVLRVNQQNPLDIRPLLANENLREGNQNGIHILLYILSPQDAEAALSAYISNESIREPITEIGQISDVRLQRIIRSTFAHDQLQKSLARKLYTKPEVDTFLSGTNEEEKAVIEKFMQLMRYAFVSGDRNNNTFWFNTSEEEQQELPNLNVLVSYNESKKCLLYWNISQSAKEESVSGEKVGAKGEIVEGEILAIVSQEHAEAVADIIRQASLGDVSISSSGLGYQDTVMHDPLPEVSTFAPVQQGQLESNNDVHESVEETRIVDSSTLMHYIGEAPINIINAPGREQLTSELRQLPELTPEGVSNEPVAEEEQTSYVTDIHSNISYIFDTVSRQNSQNKEDRNVQDQVEQPVPIDETPSNIISFRDRSKTTGFDKQGKTGIQFNQPSDQKAA